jgi:tRNA(Ile)-lysidine synthase
VHDLTEHVEQSIQRRRLLKRGVNLIVGVSGGLDSMGLLHALRALAGTWCWKLMVAHFNHQLRGRSSDADERLVRRTAARLKLPFVVERADVRRFAAQSQLSLEMAARKLRHQFFVRAARSHGIRTVALAHHADDQVELFFLRLLRGTGGEGLAGMKWRSPSPVDTAITLVRPLLDVSKADLCRFVRESGIRFRDDATNFSMDAPRNRIRNELLPLLRENYQPALTNTILRLMEIVGAESDFVGDAAGEFCRKYVKQAGNDIGRQSFRGSEFRLQAAGATVPRKGGTPKEFVHLAVAVQRRVLQWQLARLGVPADFKLIENLRNRPGRPVSVNSTLNVLREQDGTVRLEARRSHEFNPTELAVSLSSGPGKIEFDDVRLRWSFQSTSRVGRASPRAGAQVQREFFDADRVGANITLRHWRAGDRFRPIGSPTALKLQDWYMNQKIPAARRRELTIAVAGNGEIFWIEGLRIGENFKLTPKTRRKLVWQWR